MTATVSTTGCSEAESPNSDLAKVRSTGLGIKRAKRYGAFMATDVDDARSICDSIQSLAIANDEIKLILTGIIDFDALPGSWPVLARHPARRN